MKLRSLKLDFFKNYTSTKLQFQENLVAFCGPNGAGKTNLLDAIHYLCLGKSYYNLQDKQNIQYKAPFFTIQGGFADGEDELTVRCIQEQQKKKVLKKNDVAYQRISEHVGLLPVVMICPNDHGLIYEGSETRRRFLDNCICQTDSNYLQTLMQYNRILNQRNEYLKKLEGKWPTQPDMLNTYDEQLIHLGEQITTERKAFLAKFQPIFLEKFHLISPAKEAVELTYEYQAAAIAPGDYFHQNRAKEIALGRTTFGPHKDDLKFLIQEYPIKKHGSQGQQKTFLTALKLAQLEIYQSLLHKKVILMLDDLFDRLDQQRVERLFQLIEKNPPEQLFVTHTSTEQVEAVLQKCQLNYQQFYIKNGEIQDAHT